MRKYGILLVDDEPHILNSLKRLFSRDQNLEIFTAENAHDGLDILKNKSVDLIISDEKMPKVQGHDFLRYIKEHYPDVIRIILTGYTDPDIMKSAINQGEVYKFLTKPWDDDDIVITVRRALEHGRSMKERERLINELKEKNRELENLTHSLEEKVIKRTHELEKAVKLIKNSRDEARNSFRETVTLLNSVVTLFQRQIGEHSRRVAKITGQVCEKLELTEEESEKSVMAAYFHEIGRVGQNTPDEELDRKHPELGENLLSGVMGMKEIGKIIRNHHENYDGTGFPDGLKGEEIPVASRIIRAANDYDKIAYSGKHSLHDAVSYILQHEKTYYDPVIVRIFREIAAGGDESKYLSVPLKELQPNMELVNDIYLENGVLFLPAKTVVNEMVLERLEGFSSMLNQGMKVYVVLNKTHEPEVHS